MTVSTKRNTFKACETSPDFHPSTEISEICLQTRAQFPGLWVLTIFWSSSADSWTRSRSLLSTTKMRPWAGRKKGQAITPTWDIT